MYSVPADMKLLLDPALDLERAKQRECQHQMGMRVT